MLPLRVSEASFVRGGKRVIICTLHPEIEQRIVILDQKKVLPSGTVVAMPRDVRQLREDVYA